MSENKNNRPSFSIYNGQTGFLKSEILNAFIISETLPATRLDILIYKEVPYQVFYERLRKAAWNPDGSIDCIISMQAHEDGNFYAIARPAKFKENI